MAQEIYSSKQEAKKLLIDENPDINGIFAKYLEPGYDVIFPNSKQIKKILELNKTFADEAIEDAYVKEHWFERDKQIRKQKEDDEDQFADIF